MSASPARVAAYEILLRVERESSYASELLHSPAYKRLSPRDHALSTELVLGVLRWQSRIDEELADASSHPLSKLDLEILIALRLGLYQLRCLDRVPKRAALYESVELVKHARKRSAASFVNAILRKLAAKADHYQTTLPPTVELSSTRIAQELAHPSWLVERWAKEYGLPTAQKICEHDQSIPPTTIRLRTLSAEDELSQEGITLKPAQLLSSARIVESGDVTKARAFRDRRVVIQDQASQLVAALAGSIQVRAASNLRILDCCAAPGGKTLAMADRNREAAITAVDLHPHRARLLKELIREAGIHHNIQVIVSNAESLPLSQPFDRVLADVPCSGTGTLARNPEIKWRLRSQDLKDLQTRQSSILHSAMSHVRSGGRIVYSTCSLEREENETVVEQALVLNNRFRRIDCRIGLDYLKLSGELLWPDLASLTRGPYLRTIPGVHPCDGFFAAILEKV
jgi:16S rRNA (cytosine967-C5)-methyltransferase